MKLRITTDRQLLLPGALLIATGAGLAYLGLDLPHTIALTTTGLAALALYRRTDTGHDPEHHALPDNNRDGARRDLSDLTWAMHGSHGRVSERAHQRVRTLAAHTLTAHGIDLHSTEPEHLHAAAAALGEKTHHQMTTDPRPPTFKTLRAWVDAIEALADTVPVSTATPVSSSPAAADRRDRASA